MHPLGLVWAHQDEVSYMPQQIPTGKSIDKGKHRNIMNIKLIFEDPKYVSRKSVTDLWELYVQSIQVEETAGLELSACALILTFFIMTAVASSSSSIR